MWLKMWIPTTYNLGLLCKFLYGVKQPAYSLSFQGDDLAKQEVAMGVVVPVIALLKTNLHKSANGEVLTSTKKRRDSELWWVIS